MRYRADSVSFLTVLLLSSLIFSCRNKPLKFLDGRADVIDLSKDSDYQDLKGRITHIKYLPLESNDSSTISGVDKAIFFENNVYILDKQFSSLKVFSSGGKYVRTIGRLGQGVGQFSELQDFILLPDQRKVLLLCNDKEALLAFDLNGNYIGEANLKFFASNFDILGNSFYFYVNQNKSEVSGNYNLLSTDTFTKSISVNDRLFSFPNSFSASVAFSGFLVKNTDGILYSSALSDTVFQITNLGIYPRYIFSFGDHALPLSARNSLNNFIATGREYSYLGSSVVESKGILIFSYVAGSKIVLGMYNKNNHGLRKIVHSNEDPLSILLHAPNSVRDGDTFVSYIETNKLFNSLKSGKITLPALNKDYPDLYQIIPQLHASDNPILVFFKVGGF